MNAAPGSTHIPLNDALARVAALVDRDPALALSRAEAILVQLPGLPAAELLAGRALRRLGRTADAARRLAALAGAQPAAPAALWELAQAAGDSGDRTTAIDALVRLTRRQPEVADGWFLLARHLRAAARDDDAWRADLSGVHAASRDPELLEAAAAMNEGRLDTAERALAARPADDAVACRLRGEIAWRQGDMAAALDHVGRAVTLAPGFDLARDFLIRLQLQAGHLAEALAHAETLCRSPITNPGYRLLKASVLVRLGEQGPAGEIYERLLADAPDQPQIWQNLGHVLKTTGQQARAVDAYREAVSRQPTLGEAWWSLANLKTVRLDARDIAAMTGALADLAAAAEDRREDVFHLHFALGKAHEDIGDDAAAFRHYDQGNRLRRTMIDHDAPGFSAEVAATAAAFAAPFLARAGDAGCLADDPIFVVGMPRAGSTLIEQILSSHSRVEGTMELPELMMIAARLQSRVDEGEFADIAAMIASLTPADRRRLGEEYLDRTRVYRKTGKPRFVDKMPNNWQHVGLIRLILPHAGIVDARRHPLGCCFSAWKQHFARGQTFSYDLGEVGRYYRDYVALMTAFDAAAPGAVHRVLYERMVADTEGEVHRLLAALNLPFEADCLAFWRNDRAVRTASSEQVRRPIFADGVDHWRRFERWLGPLVEALGPVLPAYPVTSPPAPPAAP